MGFLNQPLSTILLQPKRMIGVGLSSPAIAVDVVLNESTVDALEITKQPVQQGAAITDHSFLKPTTLSMQLLWGASALGLGSSISDIYKKLLALQAQRVPFSVTTPKRLYTNMLLTAIGMTTNKQSENSLAINLSFEQVIIVNIGTAVVPRSSQKNAGSNGATQNTGKASFAYDLNQGKNAIIAGFK